MSATGYNNSFSFFLSSTFCLYVFQSTKFYGRVSTTCNSWSRTVVEAYNKSQTINGKKWPKFPISVKCGSRVKKVIAKNWFTPLRLNWILFKLTSGIVAKLYDAFYIFNQSEKFKLLHKYNPFSIFLLFFYKLFIRNTYRFPLE